MKIKSTVSKTNKKKYTDLEPGTRKRFEERYKLEKGNDLNMTEEQIYIYDVLTNQDVTFENLDEFITELTILLKDWGGQKFFYETPNKGAKGIEIKTLKDLTGQSGSTDIKLYSARGATDVQALYEWAQNNGISTTGFAGFTATKSNDAPFKGHFGDRAHTVKHYNQKKSQGSRLICLHLNASGSKEVRDVRDNPDFIKKGGEGSSSGGFGLKSENNFVSVAIGKSKATWDHLKGKVSSVELVK